MDYSLPGSSVHEILQTRILEWVVISFSRGFSPPRDWTQVSCTAGGFFTVWATREALKPGLVPKSHILNICLVKLRKNEKQGQHSKIFIKLDVSFKRLPYKLPWRLSGKESDCNAVDSSPGSGRSRGGKNGNPLQYSHLENSMDRGAWQAIVHGVAESQTWLSD